MEVRPPRSTVLLFLTAKPGNEAAAPPRPHPHNTSKSAYMTKKFFSVILIEFYQCNQHKLRAKINKFLRNCTHKLDFNWVVVFLSHTEAYFVLIDTLDIHITVTSQGALAFQIRLLVQQTNNKESIKAGDPLREE